MAAPSFVLPLALLLAWQQPAQERTDPVQARPSRARQDVFLDVKVVTTSDRQLHDRGVRDGDRVFMDGVATLEVASLKTVLRELQSFQATKIAQLPKLIAIDGQEARILRTPDNGEDRIDITARPRVVAGTDQIVLDLSLHTSFLPQGKDRHTSLFVIRSGQTAVVRQFAAADRGVVVLVTAELVESSMAGPAAAPAKR